MQGTLLGGLDRANRVLHLGSAGDNCDEGREAHEMKQPRDTYHRKILLVGHVSLVNCYRTQLLFHPSSHLRAAPLVADKHKPIFL